MKSFDEQMSFVKESMLTERGLEGYKEYLRITEEDIKRWKVIIDLGAGLEQNFAKEVKKLNIDTTVISVDPSLAIPEKEDLERLFPEERERRKSARDNPEPFTLSVLAQDLPIVSGSIDAILALHSVTQYVEDETQMRSIFLEIERVLKVGGEARMYPLHKKTNLDFIMKCLEGINLRCETILIEQILDEEKFLLILMKP